MLADFCIRMFEWGESVPHLRPLNNPFLRERGCAAFGSTGKRAAALLGGTIQHELIVWERFVSFCWQSPALTLPGSKSRVNLVSPLACITQLNKKDVASTLSPGGGWLSLW